MVDRPVCRIVDSILITSGVALKAELGRGLVALTQCAVAAGDAAFDLVPSKVARSRFIADLVMDHCTVTSERSIVRFGPWPGGAPGPDRPWLINSQNCAFLAMYDRRTRDTVLLRADAEALAHGAISWQAKNDAADVDCFTLAGQGQPRPSRARDVRTQWTHFWGASHILDVTGPRSSGSIASVRLWERLRPGHIEPEDLVLESGLPPGWQCPHRRRRPFPAGNHLSGGQARAAAELTGKETRFADRAHVCRFAHGRDGR